MILCDFEMILCHFKISVLLFLSFRRKGSHMNINHRYLFVLWAMWMLGLTANIIWDALWDSVLTFSKIWNATEQWWFSNGDMSLYLRASSVLAFTCNKEVINKYINVFFCHNKYQNPGNKVVLHMADNNVMLYFISSHPSKST